ncbi:MAG TPA: YusW family protein [Niallia sp.]|nr:YusW family protein [Niallia sp.]
MKKVLFLFGSLSLSILLTACGDNDEVKNPPENTTEEKQQTTENDSTTTKDTDTSTNTGYGFTKFDLDADYEGTNDALDVDYENEKNDNMEASYQDKSQDINLNGDEAIDKLDSIFSSLNFDENTPDDEVLNTITEAFNIPKDAKNVELEIQYSNGTEKEYRK